MKTAKTGDTYTSPEAGKSIVALPGGSEKRKVVDWERIEVEYRIGVLSIREIADRHGISDAAIRQYAKGTKTRLAWERDLAAKVKVKADAILRTDLLRGTLRTETASERAVVDATAAAIASIQMSQRKDVALGRSLLMKLMKEVESTTDNKELFENLGEIMSGSEEVSDSMMALFRKAVSMPQRIDSMLKLSNAQKVHIELERKVNGIDGADRDSATDAVEALRKLANGEG
jgi:predicted DNA-binding protein YlxM (UPF0122 family)